MRYNILVTGGAGYIGSTLVPRLLDAGHHVTVVDNFLFKQTSLNNCCRYDNFVVTRGDIRSEQTMLPLLKKADVIVPLAALVGAPLCKQDPIGATTTNHDAITLMLKHVSREQRILMPTTNSAYGSGGENNYCTEESPLMPISQYAIEKVAVEKELMAHGNAISFRLATVFGMSPRMRLDLLVNDFAYRAANDRFVVLFESHFKRNYIHVQDVARVFEHGLANFERLNGQIYNVGLSDANVSKRELCEHIQKFVPEFVFVDAQVGRDPDQRNYVVSNEKIEATGYKPEYSLDRGIQELLKGFVMLRNSVYGNV
ncbi:NAD-dependent epimerase/dehydratase [Bradyrhizobium sp.]|uniref:NAD-dependent epimerase/dehydratase family protein n=1 Tax=Bradyrhizobium sp. TaxID=376 RepID=UPI00262020A7|nr:NAD-dependent epimerase/dehydratase [Bradyrhizobium sp.]